MALFFLMPVAAAPWSFEQFRLPRQLLYLAGLWCVVLLAIAGFWSERRFPSLTKWNAWIPTFAAVLLLSWIFSPVAYLGFEASVGILLSLAAIWVISSRLSSLLLQRCLWATLIGGWINSLFALLQFFGRDPVFVTVTGQPMYGRTYASGLFGNPDLLGIFLVQAFFGAAILTFWNWNRKWLRYVALLSLLLFGMVCLLAFVLAALLALAGATVVGLIIVLPHLGFSWRRVAIVGGLAAVAVLLAVGANLNVIRNHWRVAELIEGIQKGDWETATHGRFHPARLAWLMASDRPFLGHGPGTYSFLYFDYRIRYHPGNTTGVSQPTDYMEQAHNEYLQTAAELGWPAVVLALAGLTAYCLWAFRRLFNVPQGFSLLEREARPAARKKDDRKTPGAGNDSVIDDWLGCAWALLTLVCTLINAAANFPLHTSHSSLLALLAVAYLASSVQRSTCAAASSSSSRPGHPSSWPTVLVIVLAAAGFLLPAGVYWASCLERSAFRLLERWHESAASQPTTLLPAGILQDLERAARLDPSNFHVNQMLGAVRLFRREPQLAIEPLLRSLRYRRDAETYLNYGVALASVGRKQEAIESFRTGLLFLPNHAKLLSAMEWLGPRN